MCLVARWKERRDDAFSVGASDLQEKGWRTDRP